MGQGTLSELRAELSAPGMSAFVWVAADARSHRAWYIDVIVSPPSEPPGWQPQAWHYTDATFIAAQVPASVLATALDPAGTRVLSLDGRNVTLPVMHDQVGWQHRPSRVRYDSVLLPWPARFYSLASPGGNSTLEQPRGYLIGDDCPSFSSYEAAFRAFFYRDFSLAAGGQVPSRPGTIRVIDERAWLSSVRITPLAMEISLGGSQLAGARVELNSADYRVDARVSTSCEVSLPLPDGLPPSAWLFLSREKEWLDYRAIGEYRAPAELAGAGVVFELPEDPGSQIQALLAQGEGVQVEFKRQLPDDSGESKRTVFKTVAAFANGYGGSVVFGVEKDEATVCGLDGIDLIAERDRLAQLTRSIVVPALEAEVTSYELFGKVVLVLKVLPGTNPPYGITLPGKKNGLVEFYVRRDATTFPARPEEIRTAVLATVPPPVAVGPWGY